MKRKPNILIIISDQQNIDTIAAYSSVYKDKAYHCHWVKTPNFDRMAEGGYSFIESYCVNPVSSPSRSAIFTGRYSVETGVTNNGLGIDLNVPNLGLWLSEKAGYYGVYCGKWHAGGSWSYPEVEGKRTIPGFHCLPSGMFTPGLTGDFIDYQVSGALSGFIRNFSGKQPFLAVAGLMNPHDICYWKGNLLQTDDRFNLHDQRPPLPPNQDRTIEQDYFDTDVERQLFEKRNERFTEEQWRNYIYDYQRMIEKLDADVGRLLDAVESRNDETIIVLTSDHGEGSGRHKRTEKNSPYEAALKVPLIFYLPGKIKQNIFDTGNIASGLDIVPTLCDYAGVQAPPNCRGESLRGILEGKAASKKKNFTISELKQTIRVLRKENYKYVKYFKFSGERENAYVLKNNGNPAKFQPGNSLERFAVAEVKMLFDILNDPWETKNLAYDEGYHHILESLDELVLNEYDEVVIPGKNFSRQ